MLAVVFAYKRPELILKLVSRIISLDNEFQLKFHKEFFSKVLLIHDGLRDAEDVMGKLSHLQTREACLDLEATISKVATYTYETNVGLTNHMFRIFNDLGQVANDCVLFEEDKFPTLEGLEFFAKNKETLNQVTLVDTLPFNEHSISKSGKTLTLFTDNGNMVISNELFMLSRNLWKNNEYLQDEFKKRLFEYLSVFLTGYGLRRAYGFYSKSLSWGLYSPDRGDALLAYALLSAGKLKTCPNQRLSEDWSGRDTRGKNVNKVPTGRGRVCTSPMVQLWGFDLCPDCEKQGVSERVGLTLRSTIRNSLEYRTKRIRQINR